MSEGRLNEGFTFYPIRKQHKISITKILVAINLQIMILIFRNLVSPDIHTTCVLNSIYEEKH